MGEEAASSSSSSSSSSSGIPGVDLFQRWMGNSARAVPGRVVSASAPLTQSPPRTSDTRGQTGSPSISSGSNSASLAGPSIFRLGQFDQLLRAPNVDLKALRELAWRGIPWKYRTEIWQLLLGYMPTNRERRQQAIVRKRKEYTDSIATYFEIPEAERSSEESEILRQIIVDLHRTCPMMPIFHQPGVQKLMERILYIWSIRHPASGYVQGMNDLLTPLFLVCLFPHCGVEDVIQCDVGQIDARVMLDVEADSYWLLTKLLDGIQDHYTPSQPGIQRMVLKLEDLIRRIDKGLDDHMQAEGVSYIQFSFRWMNCILLREMPMRAIIRLWDTYMCEDGTGFETFHTYVCAALLQTFKGSLMEKSFQDMLLFLQDMPSMEWGEEDVDSLCSQAWVLSSLYENAPSHFA